MKTKMDLLTSIMLVLGTSVFFTIAVSAWFASEKIVAVWWAFGAAFCLLVFIFARLHIFVSENLAQPSIDLIGPPYPFHFRWDPTVTPVPMLQAPTDEASTQNNVYPKFKIANTAKGVSAADVSIEWSAPPFDPDQLLASSPQLARHVRNIRPGHFELLMPTPSASYTVPQTGLPTTLNIPFLSRPIDTVLPTEVWGRALLLILADLPDQAGNKTFDIEFAAIVSWNIPDRGKPQKFVVVAHVVNTKRQNDPAIMDAQITFSVRPPA